MGTCCSGGWPKLLPLEAEDSSTQRPPEGMFCVTAQALGVAAILLGKDSLGQIWMLFLRPLLIGFVTLSKSLNVSRHQFPHL